MNKLTVVKVGGKIVEDEGTLQQLLKDFSAIEGAKVLVHGGGRSATKVAAQLGIESTMIGGRRVLFNPSGLSDFQHCESLHCYVAPLSF